MDDIIYVEEPVKEEIFSGTYVLDGPISEEDQRRKIINLMKMAGVSVENEDTLEIGFEGAEDDHGVSETQTTAFKVFQTVTKKVPYQVTKEEVFHGTYIIDEALSPKKQREKIFEMMRVAGVEVGDESTLEIGYEGVEDDNGISDAQSSPFVVYRVHKTKVPDKKISNELRQELETSLAEIKALREKLEGISDNEQRKQMINELFEKTDRLESSIGQSYGMNDQLIKVLEEIEEQIVMMQKSLTEEVKEYEDSFRRMEEIIKEQTEVFEGSLHSEEELNSLRIEFARRKIEENEYSAKIRKEIEEQKRMLANLKRKKNKIEKDLGRAGDLGISVSDYKDITSTLQKTNIMNAILDQKGLDEIVEKKASERSKEEKKQLKKAKEEIVHEISEAKKENKDMSILDAIEALYSVQVQYKQGKPPKVLLVKKDQLEQIIRHVDRVPERIVGDAKVFNYQPEEVPKDLQDADISYHREEVFSGTYILDGEKISEKQQKEKIFNLMRIAGIEVEDENDFEIGYEGVEDENGISETQSTKFVVYRKIKDDKKDDDIEKVQNNEEEEEPIEDYTYAKGFDERIVLFNDVNNNNDLYARDYVVRRFNLIPTSGEVLIEESLCYRIEPEDASYIVKNQENSYSPYFVEVREIQLPHEIKEEEHPEKVIDSVVMYHDVDNNDEKYVRQSTIVRFNLIPQSDATEIEDGNYYRVSDDDAEFVLNHQDNEYSPYQVDYREVHLGKKEEIPEEVVRTPEEETRDLIERITVYRDLDNNNEVYVKKYVVERFNLIPISDQVRIDGAICYRIENEDAGYLITHANNNYSPYEVDVQDVELGKKNVVDDKITELQRKDLVEKIVIYRDVDNHDELYAKKYVIERFNIVPTGPEVRITKAACYKIEQDDADFIIGNAHNSYSPYEVEIVDVNLGKNDSLHNETVQNEGLVERMKLFRDMDQKNQIYAKKYTLYRFNIEPVGPEVRINGMVCYPISEEDAVFISNNQTNGYSPYELDIVNIHLSDELNKESVKEEPVNNTEVPVNPVDGDATTSTSDSEESPNEQETSIEEVVEDKNKEEEKEIPIEKEKENQEKETDPKNEIVLYHNPDNPNELFVNKETLTRFAIFPAGELLELNGDIYYPIRLEDEKRIRNFMDQVMGVKVEIVYRDLPIAKKEIPLEESVAKEIPVEEPVSKEVQVEKTTPTYEGIMEKLMIPSEPSDATRFTPSNINPSRSFTEELKEGDWGYNIVHFLSSMRKASSEFLQKISSHLLGTKKGSDSMESFQKRVDSLTDSELEVLLNEYKDSHSIHQANQIVVDRIQKYLHNKLNAYENEFASQYEFVFQSLGQIRVLEESLLENVDEGVKEAYNTERKNLIHKLSDVVKEIIHNREEIKEYLGDFPIDGLDHYSFATMTYKKDLSKEYQARLQEYQKGLQEALSSNNEEEIVSNFLGADSCYYTESDVAVRMVGSRSVGVKYYSPIAMEFQFKDDDFERNMIHSVAVSSAVCHKEKDDRLHLLETSNKKADNPHTSVSSEEIDFSSWKDNLLSFDITTQLESLMIDYANGEMSQDNALSRLTQISSQAHNQYIDVINQILEMLKNYSFTHADFDFASIQEALEYAAAVPESIYSTTSRNVLDDSLYGLPKEMLKNLISASADVLLAKEVSQKMKKKFNTSSNIEDMLRSSEEKQEEAAMKHI